MMASEEFQQQFEYFKLSTDATLDDLDEQYHFYSMQLHNDRASLSQEYISQHQQQYDNIYYILLKHFIQRDCQQGRCDRDLELDYDNVFVRRYDPGVSRRYFETKRAKLTAAKAARESKEGDVQPEMEPTRISQVNDRGKEYDMSPEPGSSIQQGRSFSSQLTTAPRMFYIRETEGNIFDAPDNAVIVHAVNCLGIWGSGFAAELKKRFPAACAKYHAKCKSTKLATDLAGYCFLIPPQPADYQLKDGRKPRRWIACLFTSVGYGYSSDSGTKIGRSDEARILEHTDSALIDLYNLLEVATNTTNRDTGNVPGDLFCPKFNSGSFGVPWPKTRALLCMGSSRYHGVWNVVTPPMDDEQSTS